MKQCFFWVCICSFFVIAGCKNSTPVPATSENRLDFVFDSLKLGQPFAEAKEICCQKHIFESDISDYDLPFFACSSGQRISFLLGNQLIIQSQCSAKNSFLLKIMRDI